MVTAFVMAEANVSTDSRTESPTEALDLRQVYAENFQSVWRNLHRLGVPDIVLDDAVQDVFLVVHRRRCEFAGRSSLRTWIFGIVLRVAKDYRRAARRHAVRVQRYADAIVHGSELSGPSEDAERREANRLLHLILEELDDEERAVFVFVELEQLSVREAAAAAEMSLATCQRRLRRARIAFDAALSRRTHQTPGRPRP